MKIYSSCYIIFIISLVLILILSVVFAIKINTLNSIVVAVENELGYKDLEIAYAKRQRKEITTSFFSYLSIDNKTLHNFEVVKVEFDFFGKKRIEGCSVNQFNKVINREKVILRFFSSNCSSCIKQQLKLLNKMSSTNKERFILLTDNLNREISQYLISQEIEVEVYETFNENIGINFDEQKIPYLFLCDSNLRVTMPFVLDTNLQSFSEYFFKTIIERGFQ